MSNETDVPSKDNPRFNLSRKAILVETMRASFALGLGSIAAIVLGVGLYFLGAPFVSVLPLFALLPVALYVYDRRHERDLIITDFGLLMVRPLAVLYRVLRIGGP